MKFRHLAALALAVAACGSTISPSRGPSGTGEGSALVPSASLAVSPTLRPTPAASPDPSPEPAAPAATWHPLLAPPDARFVDAVSAGTGYVAIARIPRGSQVYASGDGVTWRTGPDSPELDNVRLDRIAGGGIHFVTIGCRMARGACISSGAWTGSDIGDAPWTATGAEAFRGATLTDVGDAPWTATGPDAFRGATLTDIAWSRLGGYLVIGTVGGAPRAWQAADGRSWAPATIASDAASFGAVAASDTGFIVIGATGDGPRAWTGTATGDWTAAGPLPDATPASSVADVARFENRWWILGTVISGPVEEAVSQPFAWSSTDGIKWLSDTGGLIFTDRITVAGDRLVAFSTGCGGCIVVAHEPRLGWSQFAEGGPELEAINPTTFAGTGQAVVAVGSGLAIRTTATIPTQEPPSVELPRDGVVGPTEARLPTLDTPAAAAGGPDGTTYILWAGPGLGELRLDRVLQESNAWLHRAPVPVPLSHPVLISGGDRHLYLTGISADGRTAPLYAYDIKRDRWTLRSRLPVARSEPAVAATSGRLYVFGGRLLAASGSLPAGEETTRVDIFTLASGRWTTAAPMPATGDRFSAVALRRLMVPAEGARGPDAPLVLSPEGIVLLLPGRAWHYDVAADSWSAGAPTLRQGTSGPAAIGPTNDIFVFGCDRIDSYSPTAKVWHVHALLDHARCDPVVAIPDGGPTISALGGEGSGEVQAPILALQVGGG